MKGAAKWVSSPPNWLSPIDTVREPEQSFLSDASTARVLFGLCSQEDQMTNYGERLSDDEIVVHVPRGSADRVRIQELDVDAANAEIVVRVSKNRAAGAIPLLGVMVK
jgi:hypothetical protein